MVRKSCPSLDNVEEHYRAGQATEDNMAYANCILDTKGYKYIFRTYDTAFPLQQWLHERAKMLRYAYMACLVSDTSFVVSLVSCVNHYMHKDFAI